MTPVRVGFPVDALVSFHYYRDDKVMAGLASTGRFRLIGDSGAFSALTQGARIDLAEYADWCRRWAEHLIWVASLDVIGDPTASRVNWCTLRDRHGLTAVPTVHAGADKSWLDAYASEGADLIGLGGMAGNGQAQPAFRWAVHMMRYARERYPHVRFHLWGVTNRRFLEALPVYSADSSGVIGAVYRFARLRLFDPQLGQPRTLYLLPNRGDVYRYGQLLRRTYGVEPAAIERSHYGNRTLLAQLSVAGNQQYAAWLQTRHQVTPPASLAGHPIGPRLHAAEQPADFMRALEEPVLSIKENPS